MRVLVTGAAGFLGSHLARALLARGRGDVVALDDFSTGGAGERARGGVRLVPGDVRGTVAAQGGPSRAAAAVLHFAAAVGTRLVARDPAGTWSGNVEGTAVVLRAAARAGAQVLVASSSEVYGPSAPVPLAEDDPVRLDLGGRREVYALSKAAGEAYALALGRAREGSGRRWPACSTRRFPGNPTATGWCSPGSWRRPCAGRPLPVHGDGTPAPLLPARRRRRPRAPGPGSSPEAVGAVVNVGDDRGGPGPGPGPDRPGGERQPRGGSGPIPFAIGLRGADSWIPPRRVPARSAASGALTGVRPRPRTVRDTIRDLLASPLATSLV